MNKILWCFKHLIAPMGAGIAITLGIMAASGQPVTWDTLGTGIVMGTVLIIASFVFSPFKENKN